MGRENGITMVSLVIAIIVIIIIGGFVVSTAINNAPIEKAVEAGDAYGRGQIKEELDIILNGLNYSYILNNTEMDIKKVVIENTGEGQFFEDYDFSGGDVIIKFKGIFFLIEKQGASYIVRSDLPNYSKQVENVISNEIVTEL